MIAYDITRGVDNLENLNSDRVVALALYVYASF